MACNGACTESRVRLPAHPLPDRPAPPASPCPAWRQVPYDVLVVSVGERPATFGVPGVREHCYFMKEVGLGSVCVGDGG